MLLKPQLLIEYDSEGKIKSFYFLTFSNIEPLSHAYKIYTILSSDKQEYNVLREHIPVVFGIDMIAGYIRHILDIKEPIILFSLENNIQYYSNLHNIIFNPFTSVGEFYRRNNTDPLFNFYNESVDKLIICFTRQVINSEYQYINTNGILGTFNPNHKVFIDKICNNIYANNYKLNTVETMNSIIYKDLSINFLISILKDDNYYCEYNSLTSDSLILSGNNFKFNESTQLSVYKKVNDKKSDIVFVFNKTFIIYDIDEWKIINKKNVFFNDNIVQQNKYKTVVYFENELKFILDLDSEFDFFIKPTDKTSNIYIDVQNKITIITSKDHLSFRSKYKYPNIPEYITLFILGYDHITNDVRLVKKKDDIKINGMYITRSCQNTPKLKRRPVITSSDFDHDNYNKLSDVFYEGKSDSNNIKLFSDIYVYDNIHYKCSELKYIGFIENIKNYANKCVPCCYNNGSNITSNVFRECINLDVNKDEVNNNKYLNPFVNAPMKLVLTDNNIGLLNTTFNKIFNKNQEINLIKSRINSCKDYVVYIKYVYSKNIDDIDNILEFVNSRETNTIVIYNDVFYTNNIEKTNNKRTYELFIIIKKKIHKLVTITKTQNNDKIIIGDIGYNRIKTILDKFRNKFNDQIIMFVNNEYDIKIEYNYNKLYINDELFVYPSITSLVSFNLIDGYDDESKIPYSIDDIYTPNKQHYIINRNLNT